MLAPNFTRRGFLSLLTVAAAVPTVADAHPRHHGSSHALRFWHRGRRLTQHTLHIQARAYLAMDGDTKTDLDSKAADDRRIPASLTKLLTLCLVFEEMKAGRIKLEDQVAISAHAAHQEAVNMNVRSGELISVREAILAASIKSANDMAVVLAEHIADSETAFAQRMNAKAQEIGMTNTNFENASGLPNDNQYTTARAIASLLLHLYNTYPEYLYLLEEKTFTFRGQEILRHDSIMYRNNSGERDPRVKIAKTGFTDKAGRNIAALAVDGENILVAVVMGAPDQKYRITKITELINDGLTLLKESLCNARNFLGLPIPPSCPSPS